MTHFYIQYKDPIVKKNYCLCHTIDNVYYDIFDAYIKNIYRTKKGYMLTMCLNQNDVIYFDKFDSNAMKILEENSQKWFDNVLTTDEINELYTSSYCHQNKTININISEKTNIKVNNKTTDIKDIIDKISDINYQKNHIMNLNLQYGGMCVYNNHTNHIWNVKQIIIDKTDDIHIDEKESIDEFWENNVNQCLKTLDNQIKAIETKKMLLLKLILEMKKYKNIEKEWENKIDEIRGLVQNIIF